MARPKTKFTFEEWCRIVYDAQIYREQMRDLDAFYDHGYKDWGYIKDEDGNVFDENGNYMDGWDIMEDDPDWVCDTAQRYGLLDYERPEEEFSLRCFFDRWEMDG